MMTRILRRTRSVTVLLSALLVVLLTFKASAADDYSAGWGPEIGAPMPVLAAMDQGGKARNLTNMTGEQGLLLFLSRSADW